MLHSIAGFFAGVPHELAVFIIAMTPVLEQRVAIPLAILVYKMPWWKAYSITMVGNILPVMILLFHADRFHKWVMQHSGSIFGRTWLNNLKKGQESFAKYEKYGLWGLMLFVISPLPGSGIFTGALIAFLMGVPFKHAWPYLCGAILGSGVVTLLLSVGIHKLF